ncbi:MAG TPA: radical SAM protein, partial [Patescibacteria group bacterium]|nr:radical SAM protein [Patescibacteria group bacterium]
PFTSSALLIEPIDLLSLATFIQSHGHTVHVLDMDAERLQPNQIQSHVKERQYDAVVLVFDYHIPLATEDVWRNVLAIAEIVKKSGTRTIVGGKTATFYPNTFLFKDSPIDLTIHFEMERTLLELLKIKEWNSTQWRSVHGISFFDRDQVHTIENRVPAEDLGSFPIPNRHLVSVPDDYIDVRTLLSSRGCPHTCKFCHVPNFWGRWRQREANDVVDEISYLISDFGAKKILFLDDNALVNPVRMEKISEAIINHGLKATLGCLGSCSVFQMPVAKRMFEAGFRWIHFGAETGDPNALLRIRKNISPDQIRSAVSKSHEIGFRIRTSWILDLPESTPEELDRTIQLILETQSEEIRLHFLALRPGSEFEKQYHPMAAFNTVLPSQYIHHPTPQLSLSRIPNDLFQAKIKNLISLLQERGYSFVQNADDLKDPEKLRHGSAPLKIVSLCPLRYGLDWHL